MVYPESLKIYEQNVCFETVELQVDKRNEKKEKVLQSDDLYSAGDIRITEIRTIRDKILRIKKQRIGNSNTNIFQRTNREFQATYLAIFIKFILAFFSITANLGKQCIQAPLACARSNGSGLRFFLQHNKGNTRTLQQFRQKVIRPKQKFRVGLNLMTAL